MQKYVFTLMVVLMAFTFVLPLAAQEEGVARVRIGYFAFDPHDIETYMDRGVASISAGWEHTEWAVVPPYASNILEGSVTPYFDVPSGIHTFTFAPRGDGLDAVILETEGVEFKPGHTYALAVVGHPELDDLKLLSVDESDAFAGIDPETNYRGVFVHNIAGAPPVDMTADGEKIIENLNYRQMTAFSTPAGYTNTIVSTVGDEPVKLFEFFDESEPRNCEMMAMVGTFPGEPGSEIFWAYTFAYPDVTLVDGGVVGVGDTISGEVPDVTERAAYSLTLESDANLNLYVKSNGLTTAGSIGSGSFDPSVYVFDSSGSLLFWNDDQVIDSYDDNAALEALALKAGDYTIQIGGWGDLMGGPFELVVESAE